MIVFSSDFYLVAQLSVPPRFFICPCPPTGFLFDFFSILWGCWPFTSLVRRLFTPSSPASTPYVTSCLPAHSESPFFFRSHSQRPPPAAVLTSTLTRLVGRSAPRFPPFGSFLVLLVVLTIALSVFSRLLFGSVFMRLYLTGDSIFTK